MAVVACALAFAFGLVALVLLCLRREYMRRTLGWRLLAYAGWPLMAAGGIFVGRFWTPTSGPYVANSTADEALLKGNELGARTIH